MATQTAKRGSAAQIVGTQGRNLLAPLLNIMSKSRASGFAEHASPYASSSSPTATTGTDTTLGSSGGLISTSSGAGKTSDLLSTIASINAAKKGATKKGYTESPDTWNVAKTISTGINAAKGMSGGSLLGGALPVVGYITAGANLGKLAKSRISDEDVRNTSGASAGELLEREASAPGVGGVLDPGISALVGKLAGDNPFTRAMGELRNVENDLIVQPVANVSSGIMGNAEKAIKNMGYIALPGSQYLSEKVQRIVNPANIVHDITAEAGDALLPDAPAGVQTAVGGAATVMNPPAAIANYLNIDIPGVTGNQGVDTGLAFTTGGLSALIGELTGGGGLGQNTSNPINYTPEVAANMTGYQEWLNGKPGTVQVGGNYTYTGKPMLYNSDPNYSMGAYSNYLKELAANPGGGSWSDNTAAIETALANYKPMEQGSLAWWQNRKTVMENAIKTEQAVAANVPGYSSQNLAYYQSELEKANQQIASLTA